MKVNETTKKEETMKTLGTDSNGTWTAAQYIIDAGWDLDCVRNTARMGISAEDAEGLSAAQRAAVVALCEEHVGGTKSVTIFDYATGTEIWHGEIDNDTWEKYLAVAEPQTGAAPSKIFLDQGLLTGQKVPPTIYAREC